MADRVVVVVDDDPVSRNLMRVWLADAGYHTIPCAEVTAATELIRTRQPDLVILDLQMGSDPEAGWKLLQVLRADPATLRIPAIMVSGNTNFLQTHRALLHANGCTTLAKPFTMEELLACATAALGTG